MKANRGVSLAVLVAALGYFVDIYDLILFGVVRQASVRGIGVSFGSKADPRTRTCGARNLDRPGE